MERRARVMEQAWRVAVRAGNGVESGGGARRLVELGAARDVLYSTLAASAKRMLLGHVLP
jgi:hypothetical protein